MNTKSRDEEFDDYCDVLLYNMFTEENRNDKLSLWAKKIWAAINTDLELTEEEIYTALLLKMLLSVLMTALMHFSTSGYSPIVMYFDYKHPDDGKIHSHVILIVGKNGDTYYAVDSAANKTKLVELTFNADKTAITTCSYARYADTSAVQSFCQWKLPGTPDVDTRVYSIMYDWGDWVDGVVQTMKYNIKQHGVNYTLSTEVLTYGSYVFKGWAVYPDLKTPVYQPGSTYTANKDEAFYAVWGEPGSNPGSTQAYTITYDYNNGTGKTVTQEKTAGTDVTLSAYDPVYEGHIFLGWAFGDDLDTVVYQTGDTYSEDADLYLYAVWEAEKVERNIIMEGTCGTDLT